MDVLYYGLNECCAELLKIGVDPEEAARTAPAAVSLI